jgi:hypothetical protein
MKTIRICAFFIVIASFSWAADWETYDLIDRLLTIREPSAPVVHENFVIFTADSSLRRVGVAFAHENFATIYWFNQLLVSQDRMNMIILPGQKFPDPYKDSGLQFYVYQFPDYLKELEYRLIINGLWTIDTTNPKSRRDPVSGLALSVLTLPARPANYNPLNGLPAGLNFTFIGPPGETVTVAGSFNGWDPFMYELKEWPAGHYSLTIPLPPGTYQYVFFHRGQRFTDPHNPSRIYARDGTAASQVVIPN